MSKPAFTFLSLFLMNTAFCQESQLDSFVNINKYVANVAQSIKAFKAKVDLQVAFPRFIPSITEGQYLHFSAPSRHHYIISFSDKKDCAGANYCTIGSVTAEIGANPVIHYSRDNKELTLPIILAESLKGYYTPGYALASSRPAQVSFRCKNVLYTVSWRANDASDVKMTLIRLAEATIINADAEFALHCNLPDK